MKKKNSKGYYKEGNLTFKDLKDGTQVLLTHARVHDKNFIKYIRELDKLSGGAMSPQHVMAGMAVLAYRYGLRIPIKKMKEDTNNE